MAARRMPVPASAAASTPRRGRGRLTVALGVDLFALACVTGALSLLTGVARGDFDDLASAAAVFATLGVLYLLAARQTVGHTLGEALLDVQYYPSRRRRSPATRRGASSSTTRRRRR